VAASVRGVFLGDDRFEPFWEAAEATGALVFVHPTTRGFDSPAFQDYYLWNTVANPLETATTAAHMVVAGVMERHPDLRVLLAHGGGALLAVRGRMRHAHGFQPQAKSRLRESPEDSIRRFHFDTLTHDDALLRALIEFAGPDRVLLGSDYPFDMGDARHVDTVRALGLAPDVEAAILAGNAERILSS
jgi:aminocarboxymuconate-semialdehyde decarboxylase